MSAPAIRTCNNCKGSNTEPHCPAPKNCGWITCVECQQVSDNFGHHISKRYV